MEYIIKGKRYNQREFEIYVEKERKKQLKKLENIIYSISYCSVYDLEEISYEQFYKDIKTAYNIMPLTEILNMYQNEKGYRILKNITGICCNSYTSSTPAMDTYYSETIFKYNSRYYKFSQTDTN